MANFLKKITLSLLCALYTAHTWACLPPIREHDYVVKENQVFYTNRPSHIEPQQIIQDVDIASFKQLSPRHAKDQYRVYYKQNQLKDADPATFVLIKYKNEGFSEYAKDKYSVFYQQTKLKDADPATFDLIEGTWLYTKDRAHVYYNGVLIPDLDPATFTLIGSSGYVKDQHAIFENGKKLPWLDANSFKILTPQYIQDKNGIYYHGFNSYGPDIIDAKTGVLIDKHYYYSKDSKYVYFAGKRIPDADPESFQPLPGDFVAKDKNHIFLSDAILKDADPATFVILGSGYAKDKNHVYFREREHSSNSPFTQVAELDAATFELLGKATYVKDKFHVYSLDKNNYGYDNSTRKLTNFDPSTFELFADSEYVKDKTQVHFKKNKIEHADAHSFRALNKIFAKDATHVYQGNNDGVITILNEFDAATFELILSDDPYRYYLKDKNGIYNHDRKNRLDGVDKHTFTLLKGGKYSLDKNHVYYYGLIIKDADPQSFTLLDYELAKDKTYVYHNGKATNLDPATFQILGVDDQGINTQDKNGITKLPQIRLSISFNNCGQHLRAKAQNKPAKE